MESSISNEELVEVYQELYLSQKNNNKVIEFEDLVNSYMVYLALFFETDSSIYGDYEFLSYVVDGFNYFYKSFFGEDNIDLNILPFTLSAHDTEVRRRKKDAIVAGAECNYTASDAILVYTLKLVMLFNDMGLVEEFYDRIQRLFYNSYVIEKCEKEKGCEKSGMEYRKRSN